MLLRPPVLLVQAEAGLLGSFEIVSRAKYHLECLFSCHVVIDYVIDYVIGYLTDYELIGVSSGKRVQSSVLHGFQKFTKKLEGVPEGEGI
ncbi:hypothetical protein J22TS3_26020 [Paenibacillus sp. J22TS3]|nr:hypothetical protein J22TS3_26020 [Paenibacillus sp. J22TS3]